MKYLICNNHVFSTGIGAVYASEQCTNDNDYYIVAEGNCDLIKKDCVRIISKEEYNFFRDVHNELLEKADMFSDNTKEYIQQLCNLRNSLSSNEE